MNPKYDGFTAILAIPLFMDIQMVSRFHLFLLTQLK